MSHFTVLVIGTNAEDQLAPFDERIEIPDYDTGIVSEEDKNRCIEYYVKEKKFNYVNNFDDLYAKYGRDWNSGSWRKHTDGTYHEYSTRNPDSKWDWYKLGGRWTGFFQLKDDAEGETGEPGLMTARAKVGHADAAYKKDIDFTRMRTEAGDRAAKEYDKAMKIIGHLPVNKTWEEIRGKKEKNMDKLREKYWAQPRCVAWKGAQTDDDFGWGSSPDDYIISKEQFIQEAKESAISTFAVVKDGKWYEKGKMGWWAVVLNGKEESEWNKEFYNLLNSTPDDTLLSVYDCHI